MRMFFLSFLRKLIKIARLSYDVLRNIGHDYLVVRQFESKQDGGPKKALCPSRLSAGPLKSRI